MAQPKQSVVIIGAGVIGLSCGIKLQELLLQLYKDEYPLEIVLVAQEWPTSIPGAPIEHSPDYASMWAGAHVRPIPASSPQLQREARWLRQTVKSLERQLQTEPWSGITQLQGVEFLEAPPEDYAAQTEKSFTEETGLPGYRRYLPHELPTGVKLGYEYQTYCINAPIYCANLLRRFVLQGGKTLNCTLKSEWEAYTLRPSVKLVINASGMGFADPKCFPTRGQTLITNYTDATKTVTKQNSDGTWSFIIPRFFNGGTVFGGTKEPHDWRGGPSAATREKLIDGGESIARFSVQGEVPSPTRVQVVSDVVGRRPTREGGMRIELEEQEVMMEGAKPRKAAVIHAYGAGGRGFEISWGAASEVVELAQGFLGRHSRAISKL